VIGQEALGEMPRAREEDAATVLLREKETLGEMPRAREVEAFLLREQERARERSS
jgi:hypothetical protein